MMGLLYGKNFGIAGIGNFADFCVLWVGTVCTICWGDGVVHRGDAVLYGDCLNSG